MKNVLKDTPITDFKVPPGVVFAKIDPKTGLLTPAGQKNYIFESFIEGTEPKKYSTDKQEERGDFFTKDLAEKVE
jgi:penicillin-binding protein 1A